VLHHWRKIGGKLGNVLGCASFAVRLYTSDVEERKKEKKQVKVSVARFKNKGRNVTHLFGRELNAAGIEKRASACAVGGWAHCPECDG
jgi:hypothetical protein